MRLLCLGAWSMYSRVGVGQSSFAVGTKDKETGVYSAADVILFVRFYRVYHNFIISRSISCCWDPREQFRTVLIGIIFLLFQSLQGAVVPHSGVSYLHLCASVIKQCSLILAKGWLCCKAGKMTVSLALHWSCVTHLVVYPPTDSWPKEGRWAPCLCSCKGVWHDLLFYLVTAVTKLISYETNGVDAMHVGW